jgi:uncharacterized membrane protein HdeD (DUF308 family)
MKYTERLKLAIVTDVVFVAILSTVLFLFEKNIIRSFGLFMAIVLITGGVCTAASYYKERRECRKWRNIWKDPTWQIAGYIILAIAIIISIFAYSGNPYASFLMFVLIMMNLLIRDIRYYRYAVKYGMDDLNDVNELANKYPEVRPMINRKQKTELENE